MKNLTIAFKRTAYLKLGVFSKTLELFAFVKMEANILIVILNVLINVLKSLEYAFTILQKRKVNVYARME